MSVTPARSLWRVSPALLWLAVTGMTFGTVACGTGPATSPSVDVPVTAPGSASSQRPSSHRPASPSRPPSASGPSATVRSVTRHAISGTGDLLAMSAAGERVWLVEAAPPPAHTGDAPAAGRLLGFDATTGASRVSVDIGGAPVAVSATADRVWVANSIGDSHPSPVGANTVDEFDNTGKLLHRYHVDDPVDVVATDDQAWVLAGVNAATLVELADGVAHHPMALTGAPSSPALAVCDGIPYAATDTPTGLHVTRVSADGHTAATPVGADGNVRLACTSGAVIAVIDNNDDGGLVRIGFESATPAAVTGPRHIQALVGTRPLWAVASDGGPARLLPVDPVSLAVGTPYTLTGDGPVLAAADADRIWIVDGHELLVLATTG